MMQQTDSDDAYLTFIHLPDNHPIRSEAERRARAEIGDDEEELRRMLSAVGEQVVEEWVNDIDLTLRETCAWVLQADPEVTWAEAADLMGIEEGTYSSKLSENVFPKIERARRTTDFVGNINQAWQAEQDEATEFEF